MKILLQVLTQPLIKPTVGGKGFSAGLGSGQREAQLSRNQPSPSPFRRAQKVEETARG